MNFFTIKNLKFLNSSITKNVPYYSRSFNPEVQIFSNHFDWDIQFRKITWVFELGPLCLIRTTSEKMFLIRTHTRKYIEKKLFFSKWNFFMFQLRNFFFIPLQKMFVDPFSVNIQRFIWIWSRSEKIDVIGESSIFLMTKSQLRNIGSTWNLWKMISDRYYQCSWKKISI